MRGDGRLYREPGSRFWWCAYHVNGKEVRQSTRETDERRAQRVLRRHLADVLRGDCIPHEHKVTLGDLVKMVETDYEVHQRRSRSTLPYPLAHLKAGLGEQTPALALTSDRLDQYILARQREAVSNTSIRIELALLSKAFTLAVRARKLRTKPFIPKPEGDPSRVREGFFTRQEVEALCEHLDADLADVVSFLFWSAWRVGEARTLEWKDYDRAEEAIRLRPAHSKNKHGRVLPLVGELAALIVRRLKARRLDCPYIFHRDGQAIGDFRKLWQRACIAIGLTGRLVHDLRHSGVKHLIDSGIDPHTVMAFSGHRTPSMLRRYHIIDLDDLRRAAAKASAHRAESVASVTPLAERTRRKRAE
jgi:integrase